MTCGPRILNRKQPVHSTVPVFGTCVIPPNHKNALINQRGCVVSNQYALPTLLPRHGSFMVYGGARRAARSEKK